MKMLLLLLVIFPSLVNSQGILFGPVYNFSNTSGVVYHAVYSLGDYFDNGIYYVIWGDSLQTSLKSSSDFGATWGTEKIVATEALYPEFVVTTEQIGVVYQGLDKGIFFKKSTDGGNTWSAIDTLSTEGINPQISNSYEVARLYLVWEEKSSTVSQVFFARSNDFGSSWSAAVNISNSPRDSRCAKIEGHNNYTNNYVYCAWIETTTDPLSDIYFTRSSNYGVTWTTPVNITNDDRPQKQISMVTNELFGANVFIASEEITSYPTLDISDIYFRRSSDFGSNWLPVTNVTNNPGHSTDPFLASTAWDIYLTWSDNTESAPDFNNYDIYFNGYNGVWGDPVKVSNDPENSTQPKICESSRPLQYLSIIWHDEDGDILARNGTWYGVPVELISFTAKIMANDVKLSWSTATEINNRGFEIQRSAQLSPTQQQGRAWSSIGFVEGRGTTTEIQNYTFTDKNIEPGRYNYRLIQSDFDGTSEYSNVIEAVIDVHYDFALLQNYPNPFNPTTIVTFSVPAGLHKVKLSIYDILGNEIAVLVNEEKPAGEYSVEWNASDFASGVYFYKLQTPEFISSKKLLLMK